MPDEPALRPATPDGIADTLAFALQWSGRKRVHTAVGMMAKITAERLVQHLALSGFVLMKRPPLAGHSNTTHMPPLLGREC